MPDVIRRLPVRDDCLIECVGRIRKDFKEPRLSNGKLIQRVHGLFGNSCQCTGCKQGVNQVFATTREAVVALLHKHAPRWYTHPETWDGSEFVPATASTAWLDEQKGRHIIVWLADRKLVEENANGSPGHTVLARPTRAKVGESCWTLYDPVSRWDLGSVSKEPVNSEGLISAIRALAGKRIWTHSCILDALHSYPTTPK